MERRTLEDYRSEGRLTAADVCACGGRYEVMLLNLDLEQQTGMARIWGQHRQGCGALDEALTCVVQAVCQEEEEQVAGWGWRQESLDLLGVTYPLYAWFLDVMPCLVCWRLIVGVPLLLFGSQGVLAFCHRCFEARGLGQFLRIGPRREGAEGGPEDGPCGERG
jgi:hypothetical protein